MNEVSLSSLGLAMKASLAKVSLGAGRSRLSVVCSAGGGAGSGSFRVGVRDLGLHAAVCAFDLMPARWSPLAQIEFFANQHLEVHAGSLPGTDSPRSPTRVTGRRQLASQPASQPRSLSPHLRRPPFASHPSSLATTYHNDRQSPHLEYKMATTYFEQCRRVSPIRAGAKIVDRLPRQRS